MTGLGELRAKAGVVLLQKGILDELKKGYERTRPEVAKDLEVGDSLTAVAPDGSTLGKVRLQAGATTARVTDQAALLGWVQERHPEWILAPSENPDRLHEAVRAFEEGEWTEEQKWAVVNAARRHLGTLDGQVRLLPTSERTLLEQVVANGGVLNQETGEFEPVPGVTVSEGTPTLYVETDKQTMPGVARQLLTQAGVKEIEVGPHGG